MLHFKLYAPHIETVAEKERVMADLKKEEPQYEKGDYTSTAKIAERFPIAVSNSKKVLTSLVSEGLPDLEDSDERNR